MLQVTDRALEKMDELREAREAEPEQGMTLLLTEGNQLAATLGTPSDEDVVYERDGQPVVIVPSTLTEALDGLVLDFDGDSFSIERNDEVS